MPNPNYTSIITTTIESRTRSLADNMTNNSALLLRLKKRGKVKPVSGGRTIVQELNHVATGNVGWFSGFDTLTTSATDTATAAEFGIREAYASMTISGLEQAQNRGAERMIDLAESKIENMEASLSNLLNTGVYSDGTANSGKQVGGLQFVVSSTPTTGTMGGINRATAGNEYWRNLARRSSVDFGGAATAATILNHMGRVYNALVRGTDMVDLIPADANAYQLFTDAMNDRQTIIGADMAEAGFTSVKFRGADVVLDGGIGGAAPANTMYFINTKYLHWRPMSGMDVYRVGGDREPINQDAIIKIIGWKGNMTTSGARFQGVFRTD